MPWTLQQHEVALAVNRPGPAALGLSGVAAPE